MKNITCIISFLLLIQSINSQSEAFLKKELEGQRVEVLIEMPASSEGIDIFADRAQSMDFQDYSSRIKKYGISLYPGDVVMITKIKKKGKHIEFQLAGGGFGTFGDDSDHVSVADVPKTSRHEEIEKMLKDDKDKKLANRKELEKELKNLERDRSILQEERRRQASFESELKKSRIQDQRLQGGSRFNIRYDYKIGKGELTVQNIQEALFEYVNFNPGSNLPSNTPGNSNTGGAKIEKGISMETMMSLMGLPTSLNTTRECGLEQTICTFEDSRQTIEAIFVEKVLVKYTVSSK